MSSEGGAETTTVLDKKRVLWSNRYKSGQCLSQIQFSVQLPSTFRDGREERPLPPTYAVDFLNIPALFVRSSYYMRISITRNLTRRVGFLTKTKRWVDFDPSWKFPVSHVGYLSHSNITLVQDLTAPLSLPCVFSLPLNVHLKNGTKPLLPWGHH